MGVQYIYDAEGRRAGVIVPIDLWDTLSTEKPADKRIGVPDPRKYRGIYRGLKADLKAEARSLRNERDRV